MADREWTNFNFDIIPSEVETVVRQTRNNVDRLTAFLLALLAALRAGRLIVFAFIDPLLAAITLVIEQLEALLAALRTGIGAHLLVLPVIPTTGRSDVFADLDPWVFDVREFPLAQINPPVVDGGGGTWGFYSTFVKTLFDTKDGSRPDYPPNHYIAGVILMTGAESLGGLLTETFRLLKLLKQLVPSPPGQFVYPVPQNLKLEAFTPFSPTFPDFDLANLGDLNAKISVGNADEGENFSVVLTWDSVPIFRIEELYVDVSLEIIGVNVYHKVGAGFGPLDVGTQLEQYVVYTTDNELTVQASIDGLEQGADHYFAVGYKLRLTEPDPNAEEPEGLVDTLFPGETPVIVTELEHYDISNVLRINIDEFGASRQVLSQGEVPNWTALRSPLSVFPPLEDAIRRLQQLLRLLRDNIIADKLAEFDRFITFMETSTQFYLTRVQQVVTVLEELQAFLEALTINGYLYGFAGKGGAQFITSEVNQALFNPSTRNRPPFEDGRDFVSGVVLIAAAPTASALQETLSLLELLFGPIFRIIEGAITGSDTTSDFVIEADIAGGEESTAEGTSALEQLDLLLDEAELTAQQLEALAGIGPAPQTDDPADTAFVDLNFTDEC